MRYNRVFLFQVDGIETELNITFTRAPYLLLYLLFQVKPVSRLTAWNTRLSDDNDNK